MKYSLTDLQEVGLDLTPEQLVTLRNNFPSAADKLCELLLLCAESYVVIAALALECGRFEDVEHILNNLIAGQLKHTDVIPFPTQHVVPFPEQS